MEAAAGGVEASVVFTVERDAAGLADAAIAELGALRVTGGERQEIRGAVELLEAVKARGGASLEDIQRNVDDLLAAVQYVRTITTAQTDGARLAIDRLLGVWQERWYTAIK